jgi:hypothetical protein
VYKNNGELNGYIYQGILLFSSTYKFFSKIHLSSLAKLVVIIDMDFYVTEQQNKRKEM